VSAGRVGSSERRSKRQQPVATEVDNELAPAERPGTTAQKVLVDAGLDHEEVREALEAENERSLATVGVSPDAFNLSPTADAARKPQWATSSKLALERS